MPEKPSGHIEKPKKRSKLVTALGVAAALGGGAKIYERTKQQGAIEAQGKWEDQTKEAREDLARIKIELDTQAEKIFHAFLDAKLSTAKMMEERAAYARDPIGWIASRRRVYPMLPWDIDVERYVPEQLRQFSWRDIDDLKKHNVPTREVREIAMGMARLDPGWMLRVGHSEFEQDAFYNELMEEACNRTGTNYELWKGLDKQEHQRFH